MTRNLTTTRDLNPVVNDASVSYAQLVNLATSDATGLNAMMNIDEMTRNVMGLTAFASMQNINDHPAFEPMQSAFEKIEAMQTALERAMNPPFLGAAHTFEKTVNSPIFGAIRSEDRIFSGMAEDFLGDSSNFITGFNEMKGIASLKDGSNMHPLAGLTTASHAGDALAASSINNAAGGLMGSSFGDDFKKSSLGLAVTSLEENAKQLGFMQGMSLMGASFAASSINNAAGGFIGFSCEASSKEWADAMPKIAEIKPSLDPMLIMPARIESRSLDFSLIKPIPISREVTLSDETIEKLAKKLAENGNKVIIIAKNKGVAIMGNASRDTINTGDIISEKRTE